MAPGTETDSVNEYGFELRLAAHVERTRDVVVGRQLGCHVHGRRIVDLVAIEPGPEFESRAAITAETIPPRAIESEVGTGRARYWKDVFACPPERARETIDAAVDCGFFERERRNGRTYVRQAVRYPDWFDRIVAIENKPDLGRPGALTTQLLTDVRLGLVDAVVLATESHVTGAHRNRIPDPVGIWRFDPATGEREVLREPAALPVREPGIEVLERGSARTDIRVVEPEAIARHRRRVAERAYGRGWRRYDLPGCRRMSPDDDGLPYCAYHERLVRPAAECGPACPGFEVGDPPAVPREELRAARTPWEPDPGGRARRQVDLDQFGAFSDTNGE